MQPQVKKFVMLLTDGENDNHGCSACGGGNELCGGELKRRGVTFVAVGFKGAAQSNIKRALQQVLRERWPGRPSCTAGWPLR